MSEYLIIGAGAMAWEYAKILQYIGQGFQIVCRSKNTKEQFHKKHGIECVDGGIENNCNLLQNCSHSIVAVGVEDLFGVTKFLLSNGIKNILVEKPACLYLNEIEELLALEDFHSANVYVAYNRRFLGSVAELKKIAERDEGINSIHFDFTEWSDRIAPLIKGPQVKQRWVLSNSTHVIDLAFYLAGTPKKIISHHEGSLAWHPSACRFAGSGVTHNGTVFSYRADWDAPGRWGITAYTKNYKLELIPLEQLHVTKRNSTTSKAITFNEPKTVDFKPGLYQQIVDFMSDDASSVLCSLYEHARSFRYYQYIGNYHG